MWRRNLIKQQQDFDKELTSHENMIIEAKQKGVHRHHNPVVENKAKKSYHKSKHLKNSLTGPSYVTNTVIEGNKRDHVIGGNVQSLQEIGSVENDDTDIEHSGYSMMEDIFPSDDESMKIHRKRNYWKDSEIRKFLKVTLFSPADHRIGGKKTMSEQKVHVGRSRTEPFARDSRRTFYPKDRGKTNNMFRRKKKPVLSHHSNRKHSKVSSIMMQVHGNDGKTCMNNLSAC